VNFFWQLINDQGLSHEISQAFFIVFGGFNVGRTCLGPRGPGRLYDPKNVVTIQGQVEKVETMSRQGRRRRGM
jgi:hypothetical protein